MVVLARINAERERGERREAKRDTVITITTGNNNVVLLWRKGDLCTVYTTVKKHNTRQTEGEEGGNGNRERERVWMCIGPKR